MNYQIRIDLKILQVKICKASYILILFFIEPDCYLIDDRILTIFFYFGLDIIALVGANVILAKYLLDLIQADPHFIIVIGGAVHSKKIFKYICRHICTLFHKSGKILADCLAGKRFDHPFIKFIHNHSSNHTPYRNAHL